MRILKSHPLLKLVNSYLIDASQPSNISYLWNFGSLLAVCLGTQIITGVTLAMHYSPNVLEAFNSIEHIMRDVNNGWLVRYLHSNTASAFFFLVYLHMGRGIYYGSYRAPRTLVWAIGTIIFIAMVGTAFLGYSDSPKWFNKLHNNKFRTSITKSTYKFSLVKVKWGWNSVLNTVNSRYYSSISNKYSKRLENIMKDIGINSIYLYEDLQLDVTKKQILKDTKGLSGVYIIINKTTQDYYIGSAATSKFYTRFSNHLIFFKGSKIVKLAVKKYKLENFAFAILDLYPNIVTKENNHELLNLEDKYLKLLLPNYNILTEAGSSFGYKHTEIDRKKMKDIYSDKRRENISNLNKGKRFLPQTIEKLRQMAINKPSMSEEIKKKYISNTKSVVLSNLDRTVYGKYSSILEAGNSINCNEKTIRRALKTRKNLVKRQWIVKDLSNRNI